MATETKVGFVLILVLLGAFSFVVYKKWEKAQQEMAKVSPSEQDVATDETGAGSQDSQFDDPNGMEQQTMFQPQDDLGVSEGQAEPQIQQADWPTAADQPTYAPEQAVQQHAVSEPPQYAQAQPHGSDQFFPAQSEASADPFAEQSADPWDAGQEAQQAVAGEAFPADQAADPFHAEQAVDPFHADRPADPFQSDPVQTANLPSNDDLFPADAPEQAAAAFQQPETHSAADPFEQQFAEPAQPTATESVDPFTQVDVAQTQASPAADPFDSRPQPQAFVEQQQIVQQGWDAAPFEGGATSGTPVGAQQTQQTSPQNASGNGNYATFASTNDQNGDPVAIYVVQPRDTFWRISHEVYGTPRHYAGLARYNRHRIPQPQQMRRGMKVMVPEPDVLAARFPDLYPSTRATQDSQATGFFADEAGRPAYRVGKNDTLTTIAHRHLGRSSRWIQIYHMNRDRVRSPHDLKVGTVLRLPIDASRVRLLGNSNAAD